MPRRLLFRASDRAPYLPLFEARAVPNTRKILVGLPALETARLAREFPTPPSASTGFTFAAIQSHAETNYARAVQFCARDEPLMPAVHRATQAFGGISCIVPYTEACSP